MTIQLTKREVVEPPDALLELLSTFSADLNYETLPADVVHAATVRIIDTLGALVAGFDGEPCQVGRDVAERFYRGGGATIFGTQIETTLEMAAFVNATTARYAEMNDVVYQKGGAGGHPSDFIMPILSTAGYVKASGKELITAVVLAYEIYLRLAQKTTLAGFDYTNFVAIAVSAASGKLLGLDQEQLAQSISITVTANNALRQSRTGHLSMWKAAAAGQAGRSGVFAAILASQGMEAPPLPFQGKNGWFNHVVHGELALTNLGGPFLITETFIKPRGACAWTISSILAAEHVGAFGEVDDVDEIVVETYLRAKEGNGTGEHRWHATTRESADHSIPYVVAAALRDGTVGKEQFDEAHLVDPNIRALVAKVSVVENEGFTKEFEAKPTICRTRVTVTKKDGRKFVGESGGANGDLAAPRDDAEISEKFLMNTSEFIDATRSQSILKMLWGLGSFTDVSVIADLLIL
jgi:2-methylcitrate dehydratase